LEERVLLSLLGIAPAEPIITYDATGTLAYDASSQLLAIDATPLTNKLSSSDPLRGIFPSRAFQIRVLIDGTGAVVGGVTGDDLVITGNIDLDGNFTNGFEITGPLLTGEILELGFLDATTGSTDQYDFR